MSAAHDALVSSSAPAGPEDEVVGLCSQLIRFDTSNPGSNEHEAAGWVLDRLSEVGWRGESFAAEPGRTNVVVHVPGRDPSRPPLLVHGHLDVVPVTGQEWTVDPFGGEIHDGCVWGRGAVDMKDMVAMMVAVARHYGRTGERPARDVVLAFLADEEAGGRLGAAQLSTTRADLLRGSTDAIGEVGGFSLELAGGRRAYLVQVAEKGVAWLRLTASGRGGHGSMIHEHNPLEQVADSVRRLASVDTIRLTPAVRQMLQALAHATGTRPDWSDDGALRRFVRDLGPVARLLEASLRHTYNPTMISAGVKENVVPSSATALVDARFLPGLRADFDAEVARALAGTGVSWTVEKSLPAIEAPADLSLLARIADVVAAEDPDGIAVPFVLAAGTDAKWFAARGISCFGFKPLRLPAGFDFAAQFHAPDEHVPIDSLTFGARALHRLLDTC